MDNIERRSSTRITATAAVTPSSTKPTKTMTPPPTTFSYTNTAKLPIDVVKALISAVERRPNLWLRNNSHGQQKRCDITPLWYEVSKDVNLPVDICRIKWGHLRDNFRKVYIRNNLTDATPTTWRFYNDMRFMENPVAENIVHQSRGRHRSPYLQSITNNLSNSTSSSIGYHKKHMADIVMPICELTEGTYGRDTMHQPSFSDISSFFDDSHHSHQSHHSHHSPPLKRIKFEGKDIMNGDYTSPDEQQSSIENDELNDDDFDEDAATDENDTDPISEQFCDRKPVTSGLNGLFTIEVPDDDDDDDEENDQMKLNLVHPTTQENNNNNSNNNNNNNRLPFKNITVDATTNTDSNLGETIENADRMFLLSLVPFMSKIDERRKLQVRQKLQNVLIEEFG